MTPEAPGPAAGAVSPMAALPRPSGPGRRYKAAQGGAQVTCTMLQMNTVEKHQTSLCRRTASTGRDHACAANAANSQALIGRGGGGGGGGGTMRRGSASAKACSTHTQATTLFGLSVQEARQHEKRTRRGISAQDTETVLQQMPEEAARWPSLDTASSTDEGSGQRVVSPLYTADLLKQGECVSGGLDHMGFQRTNEPARDAYPGGLRSALWVSESHQAAAYCCQEGLPARGLQAACLTLHIICRVSCLGPAAAGSASCQVNQQLVCSP